MPGSTRLSASGATRPPSEMPIKPTRSASIRSCPRRKRTPKRTSFALSRDVDCQVLPVEPPMPRSSTRRTAMPSRVRWSASTRNGLWPASSRSRFRAPLPLISSAAGTLPSPGGRVRVPAIFTSRAVYSTSSASYGKGGCGSWGRGGALASTASRPSLNGNRAGPWLNSPVTSPPASVPSKVGSPGTPWIVKRTAPLPASTPTSDSGRPSAPWAGMSIVPDHVPSVSARSTMTTSAWPGVSIEPSQWPAASTVWAVTGVRVASTAMSATGTAVSTIRQIRAAIMGRSSSFLGSRNRRRA